MKSDEHDKLVYTIYTKDIKFLLDKHVPDLHDRLLKDVDKMVMWIIKDLEYKYLRPTESITESLDEDFLMQFETVKEDQILAAFPDQMLTPEVCQHVLNCLGSLAESHHHAADAMYSAKELMPNHTCGSIPVDHARPPPTHDKA